MTKYFIKKNVKIKIYQKNVNYSIYKKNVFLVKKILNFKKMIKFVVRINIFLMEINVKK